MSSHQAILEKLWLQQTEQRVKQYGIQGASLGTFVMVSLQGKKNNKKSRI